MPLSNKDYDAFRIKKGDADDRAYSKISAANRKYAESRGQKGGKKKEVARKMAKVSLGAKSKSKFAFTVHDAASGKMEKSGGNKSSVKNLDREYRNRSK